MERGVWISHNLETTPLKIKTDDTAGSVYVLLNTAGGVEAGNVYLEFKSSPVYYLGDCTPYTHFPSTLPSDINKVWVIAKLPGPRITVQCNEVKVLDITTSDDTCSDSKWRTYWSRHVEQIWFSSRDWASDEYRGTLPGNYKLHLTRFTLALL